LINASTTVSVSLAGYLDEHEVARLSLHQRGDLAVVRPEHQIAFPVTWHSAVLDRCRAFADRHGIDDLAVDVGLLRVMPRSTHAARAPQVLEQLLLQRATRLDEETAVDGLV
jgi:hypothetical protein